MNYPDDTPEDQAELELLIEHHFRDLRLRNDTKSRDEKVDKAGVFPDVYIQALGDIQ